MGRIAIIAALGTKNRAIGKNNGLLWHIPDDLKRFKDLTNGHPVIMGRKTWESLPEKFRPLPNRTNLVVTRQANFEAVGATIMHSLEDACAAAGAAEGSDEIFIIGGGELYREALPITNRLYLTLVNQDRDGDIYFPEYVKEFQKKVEEKPGNYNDLTYTWLTIEK
jgi:dihydrofolate reductase